MIIPDEELENSTDLRLSSSVVTVAKDNIFLFLAIYLIDHAITFTTKNKQVAVFHFLSTQKMEQVLEIRPELLAIDKLKYG